MSAWAIPMPPARPIQIGSAALWEPLYFYSAFADEEIPWLATGYEYNDDFTELTVNIREGVEWSDGEAFDANDVALHPQHAQGKCTAASVLDGSRRCR